MKPFSFLLFVALLGSGCTQHYSGLRVTPATKRDIPRFVAAIDATAHQLNFQRFLPVEGIHQVSVIRGPSAGGTHTAETMRCYFGSLYSTTTLFSASYDPELHSLCAVAAVEHPRGEDLERRDMIVAHLVEQLRRSFPADHIFLWRDGSPIQYQGVPLPSHPIKSHSSTPKTNDRNA